MDRVKVFAPATVANVGPGFDIFGFAIEGVGDVVAAQAVTEAHYHREDETYIQKSLAYEHSQN